MRGERDYKTAKTKISRNINFLPLASGLLRIAPNLGGREDPRRNFVGRRHHQFDAPFHRVFVLEAGDAGDVEEHVAQRVPHPGLGGLEAWTKIACRNNNLKGRLVISETLIYFYFVLLRRSCEV